MNDQLTVIYVQDWITLNCLDIKLLLSLQDFKENL